MPKTAVHKNDRAMFREHYVGIACQTFPVQAESKAHAVQGSADE
jgi:hypothetical protein